MRISSYSKVHTVGHKEVTDVFNGPVVVEEKIDGSQFSMCSLNGELVCRSKGQQIVVDAPEKMFAPAVVTARELFPLLREGWVYRCEYLQKPKHNTLAYSRVPSKHLILFDVMISPENYLLAGEKEFEAARLGLERVPLYYEGCVPSLEFLQQFLDRESVLGGCKIEGVVVKNYSRFTGDGKLMTAKLVSEAFKERHRMSWRKSNPTQADVVERIKYSLRTEARWEKAIQHLRDAGRLTDSPSDIGPLIKEIQRDTQEEYAEEIRQELFNHFWPQIQRGVTAGFPEFYKNRVNKLAFPDAA